MSPTRLSWRIGKFMASITVLVLLSGCARKPEPEPEPPPVEEQPAEPAGAEYDAEALEAIVESLQERAQELPGRTTAAHRDAMHDVFEDILQALPILEGPEPSGAFQMQVRTLQAARDRLAPEAGGAPIEPAIDTGLRAAAGALRRLAGDEPFNTPEIQALVEKITASVEDLDNVRAIGRPYIAADTVKVIAQAIREMSNRLSAVSGISAEPTTAEAPPAE